MKNGLKVLLIIGVLLGTYIAIDLYKYGIDSDLEDKRLEARIAEMENTKKPQSIISQQLEKEERLENLKSTEQKEAEERLKREKAEAERLEKERILKKAEEKRVGSGTSTIPQDRLETTCNDYEVSLKEIDNTTLFVQLNQLCKDAVYGSYSDFLEFSETMQGIEDGFARSGASVQEVTEGFVTEIDNAKAECPDNMNMQSIINRITESYVLMSYCFQDVYEEFGEFPAMEFGLFDYSDYDSGNTVNNDQCILFCDSYGYEPQWAKSIGVYQAASKCTTILNNWESSDIDDQSWCTELAGYLLNG